METEELTVRYYSGTKMARMLISIRQRVRPAHDAEVGGTWRNRAWRLLA